MLEIEYMTDKNGQPKAVVIPIELWRKLLPNEDVSFEELSEKIESKYPPAEPGALVHEPLKAAKRGR